jgi:hypothetical protein
MMSRAVVAVVVLLLASATALAQSIPLPREKPDATSKTEDAASETDAAASHTEDVVQPSTCFQDMETAGVVARRAEGFIGDGECLIEDPVVLEAVDTRNGLVSLPAHPILDCRFAAAFAAWLSEVVSPVAASLLGSPVDEVVTGPGHQGRNRAGGRLSEHAIGNAVDVSGIRLVGGRRVGVETMVTARDADLEFLRAISASACGYFTTVLGPGSDAAHSDHLHLDLALRGIAEFRICMAR